MRKALLKCVFFKHGLLLALLSGFCWNSIAATPTYSLDTQKHTITIHNTGDATTEINSALSYLVNRKDTNIPWNMKFDGGKYSISNILFSERLQNVNFISDPKKPAILAKIDNFPTEYLFYTRYSKNISLTGFTFIGNTATYMPQNYVTGTSIGWKDQGVYFGSSNGVIISNNRFYNIGDAAIRITTTERDPVRGVDSFNTKIIGNYFNNIFQVTTTSNDLVHGGSASLLVQDNIFDHIWGSIKFASRTDGATNVVFHHNAINNSATDGLEIVGYNNIEISNNTLQNIARNAANCYTNNVSASGFEWGDNLSFKNNIINNTGGGIRISADTYIDGFQPQPKNVTISGNSITNLKGTAPALTLLKSSFPGLTVTANQFSNIPSKIYFYMPIKNAQALLTGNKLNNTPLTFN